MEHLEGAARQRGVRTVSLNSRDTAVEFYTRMGYEAVGDGPLLFGCIPHTAMRKLL
jgi:hypothetical protein